MNKRSQYLLVAATAVGVLAMGLAGWGVGRMGTPRQPQAVAINDPAPMAPTHAATDSPASGVGATTVAPGQLVLGDQTQQPSFTFQAGGDGHNVVLTRNGNGTLVLNGVDGPGPQQVTPATVTFGNGNLAEVRTLTVNGNFTTTPAPAVNQGGSRISSARMNPNGNTITFTIVSADGTTTNVTSNNNAAPGLVRVNGNVTITNNLAGGRQPANNPPQAPVIPAGLP